MGFHISNCNGDLAAGRAIRPASPPARRRTHRLSLVFCFYNVLHHFLFLRLFGGMRIVVFGLPENSTADDRACAVRYPRPGSRMGVLVYVCLIRLDWRNEHFGGMCAWSVLTGGGKKMTGGT